MMNWSNPTFHRRPTCRRPYPYDDHDEPAAVFTVMLLVCVVWFVVVVGIPFIRMLMK